MNVKHIKSSTELPMNRSLVLYAGVSDEIGAKWFRRKYRCIAESAYRWDDRLYIELPEGAYVPQRKMRLR